MVVIIIVTLLYLYYLFAFVYMTSLTQKEVFRKVSHSLVGIDNPIFGVHGMI